MQVAGGHLVELARGDPQHHPVLVLVLVLVLVFVSVSVSVSAFVFVFAFSQAGPARAALLSAGGGRVHRGVYHQCRLDAVGQRGVATRLFHEVEGAMAKRVHGHRKVAVAAREPRRVVARERGTACAAT